MLRPVPARADTYTLTGNVPAWIAAAARRIITVTSTINYAAIIATVWDALASMAFATRMIARKVINSKKFHPITNTGADTDTDAIFRERNVTGCRLRLITLLVMHRPVFIHAVSPL